MTIIAPDAAAIDEQLRTLPEDEVLALLIPYQRQHDRARAINHFDQIVAQLRAAGWSLKTGIHRKPDGEIFAIEPIAAPSNTTSQEDTSA
jgi:hypothetical protein